jgi:hypothetical protein
VSEISSQKWTKIGKEITHKESLKWVSQTANLIGMELESKLAN